MTNQSTATGAVARYVGFPEARVRQIARRLREAELIPAGAPGVPPELDRHGLLSLLIALSSNATAAKAPAAVATYSQLVPGGADVGSAPGSVPRSARSVLEAIAAEAADGRPVAEVKIEFVTSWPEIALHWADGKIQRFREKGSLATTWGDGRLRSSITINGAAFGALFQEVFA